MKKCPQCGREYDNSMMFCLDDGAELLYGPASVDEPATAILHATEPPSEAATRAQIHMTHQTAVLPTGTGHIDPKARGLDKRLLAAPLLVAIIVLGGLFGYRYFKPAASEQISSIAVLPFENRSDDADTEYLSDGLAESLIYRLSQLPNLKVSPTSSVTRYKGKDTDISQIANELEVDAVMSGRVSQRGDTLTINVELIDARTKKLLWAEQYDRKMADLLATQREIATAITQKLQLKLAGDEAKGITKKYTNSNEAYQLYLKARYHFAKRTKTDMLRAADYYRQATVKDSNFALAYALIAEVYLNLPAYSYTSPDEALPAASDAVHKALDIDPGLAEAHTFRGFLLAAYEWDWDEADREFKRALDLDPNSSAAHLRYGQLFLGPTGRLDESLAELKAAHDLEPLDIVTGGLYAWTYIFARQKEKALELARKTYDLEPGHPFARYLMAMTLNSNGLYGDAIAICENALMSDPKDQYMLQQVGLAYALSGQRVKAEEVITKFKDLGKVVYVGSYNVATVHAAMGQRSAAFSELEKAYQAHDFLLSRLKVDPFMDSLRDDPRFGGLLKRMNLPE